MKPGKTFSGYYYGPDAEIKEYPRAVKCQGKCGYGYNCGTCRYGIISAEEGAPQRCMCRKDGEK
jgi:hypothetical protein